jgi:hypothetical protein
MKSDSSLSHPDTDIPDPYKPGCFRYRLYGIPATQAVFVFTAAPGCGLQGENQ